MSITLGAVITAARARHPAFDVARTPNGVLAAALSAYQNRLIAKGVTREKTFGTQKQVCTIAQDVNTPSPTTYQLTETHGVTINGIISIVGGTLTRTDGAVEPIPYTGIIDRFGDDPAVYLVGEAICRNVSPAWLFVTSIEVWYRGVVAALTALAGNAGTFTVPDGAFSCLVEYAAYEMALRAEARGVAVDVPTFLAGHQDVEAQYLSSLRLSRRARTVTRREVEF